MKPSDLTKAMEVCYYAKQPPFIWGQPGVGKSDKLKQFCESMGIELIDRRATMFDPTDLNGFPIPDIKEKVMKWLTPDFLPTKGKGILFLDELNSAVQSVQTACYSLVLDRKSGDYILPENWVVFAAGNRETDRSVTHRMPSALANRFIHLELESDFKDWKEWANTANIIPEIISFLQWRPELLNQFDPKKNDKAFATPRTWEIVNKLLKSIKDPSNGITFPLICGTVGEGAATEFMAFLDIFRKLPNPVLILKNPESANVPTDPATLYAVCGALSHIVDKSNFAKVVVYANRLPAEYSVLLVLDCSKRKPDVVNTDAYINWSVSNQEVLL